MSSPPPPQPLIPNLPDDLSILILARFPLSSHSTLALVSRSWRAALLSPDLLAVRSHRLRLSDPVLCLNLRKRTANSQYQWILIDPLRLPLRLTLPNPPRPTVGASVVALSGSVYVIGGSASTYDDEPFSGVQVLDPVHRTWSPGPCMSVGREFAAAAAVDGRVYVLGGCPASCEAWAEVLDGSKWNPVESPPGMRQKLMHGSAVLDGRLLAMADRGGVSFDPSQSEWEAVPGVLDHGWRGRSVAMVGLLYSYDYSDNYRGKIKGYDPKKNAWFPVEELEKMLPKFLCGATLLDLGGVLCVVWEGRDQGGKGKETRILCAGVRVSRTSGGGLRGSLAWPESVLLTAPEGSMIAHCICFHL